MDATQRTGTLLGGTAIAVWLLVAVGTATAEDDSAAMRAGLVALLAIALSVGGAVVLVVSTRTAATRGSAAVSLAAWVLYQAPVWGDLGIVLPVLAVLSLTVSVVCTAWAGRGAGVRS